MIRRHAWVLNLDAEFELARAGPGYVPRRKLLAQLAERGAGAQALLGPQDILLGAARAAALHEPFVGRAWCPTPQALARLRESGVEPEPAPTPSVLRRVNHRLFAHELGGGLCDQAYVESRAQLLAVIDGYRRNWLLKRPLSFAGRGQLRVIGPLTDKQWTWVSASLEKDGLLVEPLVRPTFEVSLHGFIWQSGRVELGRVCAQDVSERGVFRAVRLALPGELSEGEHRAFLERGQLVASALRDAGYFGPFGIDGYRFQLDGTHGFCSLGEVNARYTLGFRTGFTRHPSELWL